MMHSDYLLHLLLHLLSRKNIIISNPKENFIFYSSMLVNLSLILSFTLITFVITLAVYPLYIKLLKRFKAWKTIRDNTATGEKSEIFSKLHEHKAGTPTMGGWLFLIIMSMMILSSILLQKLNLINYSLRNQQETYIILFGFFSMGTIGLIDDILNIKNIGKVKGLSIRAKMFGMVLFAAFISYWFYAKLGIDYINLRPLADKIELWIFSPILTFIATLFIVNAINITDWLDGLAGGLSAAILLVFAVATLLNQTFIATTVLGVCIAILGAFMFYNVNPAKVFMWDSGAFALGGIVATTLYLLNMRTWILVPFLILFAIFIIELCSSWLQMSRKKIFKKKLFPIAPFHHLLEFKGMKEYSIVMQLRLVQVILALVAILLLLIQYSINSI